jgi:hypothetical protein
MSPVGAMTEGRVRQQSDLAWRARAGPSGPHPTETHPTESDSATGSRCVQQDGGRGADAERLDPPA